MGTNYYVSSEKCLCCGRSDDDLHIGKSSAGWVFALRVHPDKGLNSIADWLAYLGGKSIRDEYGASITLGELVSVITERKRPDGVALMRSPDARHGEGTWDYHERDFS